MPIDDNPLPPLVVRVDTGAAIGVGHAMRSLALAERWRRRGSVVVVVGRIEEADLRERMKKAGIRHVDGNDGWKAVASEAAELDQANQSQAWILVDGYHLAAEAIGAAAGKNPVIWIDDLGGAVPPNVRIVLNQNAGAERVEYVADADAVLLRGSRYTQIREEFDAYRDRPRKDSRPIHLLVSLGGSAVASYLEAFRREFEKRRLAEVRVTVATGPGSGKAENAPPRWSEPVSSESVPSSGMPSLMAEADVALTAAGSTCWELAFLGVPAVTVTIAENQRAVAREMDAAGAGVDAGWLRDLATSELVDRVLALGEDAGRCLEMGRAGRALVDGQGGNRVLDVVECLSRSSLANQPRRFRPAELGDVRSVWNIANDPLVRQRSFEREPIPFADHERWFEAVHNDPNSLFLVFDVGGSVAAQIRYRRSTTERAEVHFSVAAGFRGKGLATAALRNTFDWAVEALGVREVIGVVLPDNVASLKAFTSAAYQRCGERQIRGQECAIFKRSVSDHAIEIGVE